MADGETMFDHVVKIGFGMVNLNKTFCHVVKICFGMVNLNRTFCHVAKFGFSMAEKKKLLLPCIENWFSAWLFIDCFFTV